MESKQGDSATSSRPAPIDQPPLDPAAAALADEVRLAFSQHISDAACATFLRARRAQLPWEALTSAVGDGVSVRFESTPPQIAPQPASTPRTWLVFLTAVGVYAVLRPLLGLGHELSVCLVSALVHAVVGTALWQPFIGWLGLDPIYTGAAVRAAGGVQVVGLAVAAPLGTWLHVLLPWVVASPNAVAPEAGVSMVAAPGASALGRGLASFGADVFWLTSGLWLTWSYRRRHTILALLGLLIQAQIVINHLLDVELSIPDLEASGLPFALAIAAPNGSSWFSQDLGHLPDIVRTIIVGGSLVLLGYACATVVVIVFVGSRRLVRGRVVRHGNAGQPGQRRLVVMGCVIAIVTAVSPLGALAMGEPNWSGPASTPPPNWPPAGHPTVARVRDRLQSTSAAGLTRVQIVQGSDGGWQYLVAGQAQVMRGVGYNPQYAALNPSDRATLYQRDFSAMHQLGINTIEGWFEPQFDQTTLDYAARNDIGVLMPFELNQDWPYENPNVQQSILDHVSAYVERYKNHPAVRMWAPGNENLHRILYPHLTNQGNDPTVRARAEAFAAFLPVLVDRIHALDPDHPVIYRDAEDVYLPTLKAAFQATGVERPWLVYGANVYSSSRLQQIVAAWPSQWLGGPLVISEFAPGGVAPAERAVGFEQDWSVIRSRPDLVLGGLAYTWATNGPEQLDRLFGLVDPQAVPTDGALAALSVSYLADLAQTAEGAPPG